MHSHITTKILTHTAIGYYLPAIARLRIENMPLDRTVSESDERIYLEHFIKSPESLAILVFDKEILIAASLGIPLMQEPFGIHIAFKKITHDYSGKYFYFAKSIITKKYQNLGLTGHFFEIREAFALEKGYDHICFYESLREQTEDISSLHAFWRQRGYTKISGPTTSHIMGEVQSFWKKEIHERKENPSKNTSESFATL